MPGQARLRALNLPLVLLPLMLLLSDGALAVACEAVFANAVGTTGKKLEIDDNASLVNTGDGVLSTGDLKTDNGTACDGQACSASGSDAPMLPIPPHNTKTDSKNNSLSLAPGDHYFDKLEFDGGNTLTLTGSGQVRVHVAGSLKIGGNARINVGGDPLDLVFLVDGNVDVTDNAQVNAVIYATKKVEVKDNAAVQGAVVGAQAKIRDNASVRYTSTAGLAIDGVCSPAVQLDHLRLLHDGSGLAGVREGVTVQACANADCSQLFTGSVTLTLSPVDASSNWSDGSVSGGTFTVSGGQQLVYLDRSSPGTFNIGAVASPAAPNPTRCFVGAGESCTMTYVQPTLLVTLADQVAGGTAFGSVSPSDCWSDFQSTSRPVAISSQYVSPAWTGPGPLPTLVVNGTTLPTDGSAVMLDLAFDAGCSAPLQVDYPEAGRLDVSAAFTGSGALSGLSMLGSGGISFYPAQLRLDAVDGSGGVLTAAAAGAGPVQPAGSSFTLRATALNLHGAVTRGYRPQGADRLRAYVERTGPLPGFDGALGVSAAASVTSRAGPPAGPADYAAAGITPAEFVDGVYTYSLAGYSEVGLIRLYLQDVDYLGHAIAAVPLDIGRFVPARFDALGSLIHRFLTPGCAGGGFSYMGEPLRLSAQLTALNAAGGVTRNYQGDFASFSGGGLAPYAGVAGDTVGAAAAAGDLSGRLAIDAAGLAAPWSAGTALLDVDLRLLALAAPDGPHDATVLGLAFADADGVRLAGLDADVDGDATPDHRALGTGSFRRARVAVGNAHGSELRPLDIPVVMQFYAGAAQGFLTHTLDGCSPITTVALNDADATDALLPGDGCIVDPAGASGPDACAPGMPGTAYRGTALWGVYAVSLAAPGAGKTGALHVAVDAPAWAEFDWTGSGAGDPRGLATFGIHNRATSIIYQREVR